MVVGLAFISAQFLRPNIQLFKDIPQILALMHLFSTVICGSLFFTFLFELTSMSPTTRFKVFHAEIVKVFMTLVIYYFIALCFTSWLY